MLSYSGKFKDHQNDYFLIICNRNKQSFKHSRFPIKKEKTMESYLYIYRKNHTSSVIK